MSIIAKPVIKNQFYILTQDDKKIGNIEATGDGFAVRINDKVMPFKTIAMIRKQVDIEFPAVGNNTNREPASYQVQGYPSGSRVYNPIWNVQHRLPLYTKSSKSRSWFAAGWYQVKQRRTWCIVQSPKLITLERYPYQGPFYTKEQANNHPISIGQ
jgi:hypothetical protein